MMKFYVTSFFCLSLALPFAGAISLPLANAADETLPIRLNAQLWTRPLGAASRLKFKLLGDGLTIHHDLAVTAEVRPYTIHLAADPVTATAIFIRAPAKGAEPAYFVTQVQIFDAHTGGLIAECANDDSIGAGAALGVGVCSGIIGNAQYGLTLSKGAR